MTSGCLAIRFLHSRCRALNLAARLTPLPSALEVHARLRLPRRRLAPAAIAAGAVAGDLEHLDALGAVLDNLAQPRRAGRLLVGPRRSVELLRAANIARNFLARHRNDALG